MSGPTTRATVLLQVVNNEVLKAVYAYKGLANSLEKEITTSCFVSKIVHLRTGAQHSFLGISWLTRQFRR